MGEQSLYNNPVVNPSLATQGAGILPSTLPQPDWVSELLKQTGEAGVNASSLEAGFSPAVSGGLKMGAGTLLDIAKLATSLYGNSQRQGQADDLMKAIQTAQNAANPMGDRSQYVDELSKSYTNPWGSADANASRRRLQQIADRQGAKRGINPLHSNLALEGELSRVLDERRKTLGTLAGAQFNPADIYKTGIEGLMGAQATSRGGTDQITAAIGDILKGPVGSNIWDWLMGD